MRLYEETYIKTKFIENETDFFVNLLGAVFYITIIQLRIKINKIIFFNHFQIRRSGHIRLVSRDFDH